MKSLIDKKLMVIEFRKILNPENEHMIMYYGEDVKEALDDYKAYRFWLKNYRTEEPTMQLICKKIQNELKQKYNLDSFDFLAEDLILIKVFGDFKK